MRPLTVPQPVTTPSPGIFDLLHAEIGAAVLDEHVELLEGAFIEEEIDAFAGGELAARMLGGDALFTAAGAGDLAARFQLFKNLVHSPSSATSMRTVKQPVAMPSNPPQSDAGRRRGEL